MKTYIVTFSGTLGNTFNKWWSICVSAHDRSEAATIIRQRDRMAEIKGIRLIGEV